MLVKYYFMFSLFKVYFQYIIIYYIIFRIEQAGSG